MKKKKNNTTVNFETGTFHTGFVFVDLTPEQYSYFVHDCELKSPEYGNMIFTAKECPDDDQAYHNSAMLEHYPWIRYMRVRWHSIDGAIKYKAEIEINYAKMAGLADTNRSTAQMSRDFVPIIERWEDMTKTAFNEVIRLWSDQVRIMRHDYNISLNVPQADVARLVQELRDRWEDRPGFYRGPMLSNDSTGSGSLFVDRKIKNDGNEIKVWSINLYDKLDQKTKRNYDGLTPEELEELYTDNLRLEVEMHRVDLWNKYCGDFPRAMAFMRKYESLLHDVLIPSSIMWYSDSLALAIILDVLEIANAPEEIYTLIWDQLQPGMYGDHTLATDGWYHYITPPKAP